MSHYVVYELIDPVSNTTFYIGVTKQPLGKRLSVHKTEARATVYTGWYKCECQRCDFIRGLGELIDKIEIRQISIHEDKREALDAEKENILLHEDLSPLLTNVIR